MFMASGSTGNCYICGAELGKTAMKNHILKAHSCEDGGQECLLLKIEGAYNKDYWLFIDVAAHKSLSDVDKFLRMIWLECCGHMSAFRASGQREIGKRRKLSSLSVGDKFTHEYDFGDTTETLITVMGATTRKLQKEAVRLLARNVPPKFECAECGAPAEYICTQCMYDSDNPFYCGKCGEEHEHEDMLMPVTNSPRMGVCGYDGELDTFAFVPPKSKGGVAKG
jgi:hypothetical protein